MSGATGMSTVPTWSSAAPGLGLDEAHVWYSWVGECRAAGLLDTYRDLLDASERQRLDRFAFEYLRDEFLVTRALCRTTLSHYAAGDPREWTFSSNSFGRPELSGPEPVVRFNLSNARSLVACVITRRADAGIDVEELDRGNDPLDIAGYYFSPPELADLFALPEAQRRNRFFALWTLKEAYIKARGMGLSIPLDGFSFRFGQGAPSVTFASSVEDEPSHWQFETSRPSPVHAMAIAIRHDGNTPFRVRYRRVVPLHVAGLEP